MRSTEEVLNHHLETFGKGDLKGVLSDYTDQSLLFTPKGVLHGPKEMKPLFEAMFAEFGKPGVTFKMMAQFVEGETAYIVWSAETPDNVYGVGTDTFVVRGGKIVTQTFAGKIDPKNK
jgi:ketosteroid isomerase-like protein